MAGMVHVIACVSREHMLGNGFALTYCRACLEVEAAVGVGLQLVMAMLDALDMEHAGTKDRRS